MTPAGMGGFEGLRDLASDVEPFPKGQRSPGEPLGQGLARHQLHDETRGAARVLQPIEGGDTRMVQRGEHAGLAVEPRQPIRVAFEPFGEDLDRHVAAEAGIAGSIDLAHPSLAEEGNHLEDADAIARFERHPVPSLPSRLA